ncbi:MAG: DUF523 and DUF1722 domain-containing protein [Pseudomonadales bacterium]
MTSNKPVVGIGACLTGQKVRYNGDSKRKNQNIEALKGHIQLNAFCPEMGIGMGVPRATVRLVGEIGDLKIVDSNTQTIDYSAPMEAYAATVVENNPDMAGYILVKGSPSCGYERVKRYNDKGNVVTNDAMGLFAAELHRLDPLLPLEEDGRMHDHKLRENFVCRVYAYHEWKQLVAGGISHRRLITFWARYKYLVMAHHIASYKSIGQLLANAKAKPVDVIANEFIQLLMQALNNMATRKTRSNVLEHVRGYLKKQLSADDKQELSGLITQYRSGFIPLVVPLTLLRHHFKHHQNNYIDQQAFFLPYPDQLSLTNHV